MEYEEVKTSYDEVKVSKKEVRTDSYFDGKVIEYIGYKLLGFLITVVTLTIAKPWADKLILEYKINHTIYNGKRLKFEGKGASLFVQRFKWILLTIVTLGIYSFWIPIKMEKWVVSNIHFEDEELNSEESYFDGKLIQMIGVNLFTYLLTLISFGLLLPYTVCYKEKWIAKHTIINRKRIVFDGKAMSLIGHYILWWFLTLITFGIYGLWLSIKIYGWQVKNTHIKLKDEKEEKTSNLPMIFGALLALMVLVLAIIFIPKINWDVKTWKLPDIESIVGKGKTNNNDDGEDAIPYEEPTVKPSPVEEPTKPVKKKSCSSGYKYNDGYCYDMSSGWALGTCAGDVDYEGYCYTNEVTDETCGTSHFIGEVIVFNDGYRCFKSSYERPNESECAKGYKQLKGMCYRYTEAQ